MTIRESVIVFWMAVAVGICGWLSYDAGVKTGMKRAESSAPKMSDAQIEREIIQAARSNVRDKRAELDSAEDTLREMEAQQKPH